jgi:hypothetical protein
MVKATFTTSGGRAVIVIGISQGNVDRLQAGQPIYFDPAVLKIAPGTPIGGITLFYGVDEAELARTLRTLIGPETEIIVVPQGDARPQ